MLIDLEKIMMAHLELTYYCYERSTITPVKTIYAAITQNWSQFQIRLGQLPMTRLWPLLLSLLYPCVDGSILRSSLELMRNQ
jgi:hypothetical protein